MSDDDPCSCQTDADGFIVVYSETCPWAGHPQFAAARRLRFEGHPDPLCLATDEDPFCRRHPWSLAHVDAFTTGGSMWAELERIDGMPVHALPPSPLCARCEHQLCPCCPIAWCDRITECVCWEDHDGECSVVAEDWKAWSAQIARCRLDDDRVGHHCITLQLGPWWPWKERQWIELLLRGSA